jgi:hypothetical protein
MLGDYTWHLLAVNRWRGGAATSAIDFGGSTRPRVVWSLLVHTGDI